MGRDQEKERLGWMLLVALAWMRRGGTDDGDDPGLITLVDAVGGQFRRFDGDAANDLEAQLLAMLLVWVDACAKYLANVVLAVAFSRVVATLHNHSARLGGMPRPARSAQVSAGLLNSIPACANTVTPPHML